MSMNTPKPSGLVEAVACISFAVVLVVVTAVLAAIAWRDGNTPLVSQAMTELGVLGGIATAVLSGILGFKQWLSNGSPSSSSSTPSGVSQPQPVAQPDPSAVASALGAAASDVAAIVASASSGAAAAA